MRGAGVGAQDVFRRQAVQMPACVGGQVHDDLAKSIAVSATRYPRIYAASLTSEPMSEKRLGPSGGETTISKTGMIRIRAPMKNVLSRFSSQ